MSDSADHLRSLSAKFQAIVGEDNVRVLEPMSEHTTFQIGGPADLFIVPDTFDDVCNCVNICKSEQVPYFILGRGSDLLVCDAGYRGVVISMTDGLVNVAYEGEEITCQAGVTLREASEMACELGLSGLEFACGIPGSCGGALFMNAGAYGGCMADVVQSAKVLSSSGEIQTLSREDLHLGYRQSRVKDDKLIVLSVTFSLRAGNPSDIRATMDDFQARREEKQPLELPSAGSTFKRPEGYFVGKLVSDAGLKGFRIGNAVVSEKHAGFVVNLGEASAKDVHAVIEHVQTEIKRQFDVELTPEVQFLGE